MSSIDKNIRVYSKNSFDRFGDDLSELLLIYLSIEDTFRSESVSKQLQRSVYLQIKYLYIFRDYNNNNRNVLFITRDARVYGFGMNIMAYRT